VSLTFEHFKCPKVSERELEFVKEENGFMDKKPLNYQNMSVDKLQDALQSVNINAGKQAQETLKELMEAVIKKGIMPKQALQIADETMEAIYTQGYNLYNQGKYFEASYLFRLLMMLDPITPKYTLGVAACLHRAKDFKNAANIYTLCAALDPTNPLPHFHAADCYLKLKAFELARFSLSMAINIAGEQPQYTIVKERAILMRSSIGDQINKSLAEEAAKATKEQAK
jgi:type III secretion system low calcium response chaperone LcrH/SycD